MPNLALQLEVLNQTIVKLIAGGDPRGTLLKNNKTFAALGALGPDVLRYLPISQALSDALFAMAQKPNPQINTLPLNLLEELFLNPVGAAYAVLFRVAVVPLWPVINKVKQFLDEADAVAAAEDKIGAVGLVGKANDIQSQSKTLKSTAATALPTLVAIIGQMIALPPWMEQTLTFPFAPADSRANRLSEFLRWHETAKFAQKLIELAGGDDKLRAFALGYLCHIAAAVTAEPFVDNITGGPYRTHWWRNRWVSNFVDSWTFGFFETGASMAGDNPTPLYKNWKSLPNGSDLEQAFNVGALAGATGTDVPDAVKAMASGDLGSLPGSLPANLADMIEKAVEQTYPAATRPDGFSADTFKRAYVGAFAVYWFMTSGSGPMGDNPLPPPPATCNGVTPPSWVSSGSAPTPQQGGLNTAGAVCALLLAILAFFELLVGDIPGAAATLALAFNAPIIDWDKVRCNLWWLRKTLVDAENALRDALVTGGLAYPPAAKLGAVDVDGNTHPVVDKTPPGLGVPLCKSNTFGVASAAAVGLYPQLMDTTNPAANFADLNFNAFPLVGVEGAQTEDLIPGNQYPNFVVNGSGLQNGGLMVDGVFPTRGVVFGDAVSNAVALIGSDGKGLPNYNLDGDRGYGWKTWNPHPGTVPANPPVQPDSE